MKKLNGFSLLEVLAVLAIVAIIAALGYPIYTQHLVNVERMEAANTLSQIAVALEGYHIEHNTYHNATLAALKFSELTPKNSYHLKIQSATHHSYVLAAEPMGSQAEHDPCGTLLLYADGKRMNTGKITDQQCW